MTQDIRIAYQGGAGAEAVSRRAALEDKDQTEGLGVRALAVLFIGFAVYLKTFFTASQAEDTGALQDQPMADAATPSEMANLPAATGQGVAPPMIAAASDGNASQIQSGGFEVVGDLPTLVALELPVTPSEGGGVSALEGQGAGRIATDPALSADVGNAPGEVAQAGTTVAVPGRDLPSDSASVIPGGTGQNDMGQNDMDQDAAAQDSAEPSQGGSAPTSPDASQTYDIATLFQNLGVTLYDRADSTVDRVTDLAIGDLMRDLTLDEFRAQLGQVPQDPGRPLDRLISVLNDEGSREAFLARTGLTQDATLDASYSAGGFDPQHAQTTTEPDTGPDLFL